MQKLNISAPIPEWLHQHDNAPQCLPRIATNQRVVTVMTPYDVATGTCEAYVVTEDDAQEILKRMHGPVLFWRVLRSVIAEFIVT